MRRNGIITMTALVPTLGHAYLIEWAAQYLSVHPQGGDLHVILMSRPREPLSGRLRCDALSQHFGGRFHFHLHDEEVPQNPNEHPEFWGIMRRVVNDHVPLVGNEFLFASETYGIEFAACLEAEFVPCDISRDIVAARGTDVRLNLVDNFASVLPEYQPRLRRKITFFGAESCGKTTASRRIADALNGHWVHEWARPYLEQIGPEVTPDRLQAIVCGQYAAQKAVAEMRNRPFIIQDTDLLSTIGYYELCGIDKPKNIESLFRETASDLYVVMNDRIPFTPDVLRYGGNVRETNDDYWLRLLGRYGCAFHYVQTTDRDEQSSEIFNVLMADFERHSNHVSKFVRT